MELMDYARSYRDAGYSVIPIEADSKVPLISWKEYQQRLATDDELEFWFNRLDCNIAIVTGHVSNLFVVDVDPRNGGTAIINGQHLGRATTVTGGNGLHYYYSLVPEASVCKPGIWKGVDLKSEGGYVLAPPSRTTASYCFTAGEHVPPERRTPPQWLRDEITGAAKPPSGKKVIDRELTFRCGKGNFLRIQFHQVPEGGRNNHAAKLYGSLLYEGIEPGRAANILVLWNHNLHNPLPDDELRAVIASITAAHVKKVRENEKLHGND